MIKNHETSHSLNFDTIMIFVYISTIFGKNLPLNARLLIGKPLTVFEVLQKTKIIDKNAGKTSDLILVVGTSKSIYILDSKVNSKFTIKIFLC